MGTRYRYFTSDNGPPNGGAPPGAPSNPPGFNPFNMSSATGPVPPFAFGPGAPAPSPYAIFGPSGGPHCCYPAASIPPPGGPIYLGPPPADVPTPPPAPVWIGASPLALPPPYSDAPPRGGRVKGLLPRFPDRNSGYIFPKSNCTFHIVQGDCKPWEWRGLTLDFRVAHAPTNMTIGEFIEQVGAIDKATPDTPRHLIGVTEALEVGNGVWHKGTTYVLGDGEARMSRTLENIGWGQDRGEAGRSKPVTLVFTP